MLVLLYALVTAFSDRREGNVRGLASRRGCKPVFTLPTSNRMLSASMIWKLCNSEWSVLEQLLSFVLLSVPTSCLGYCIANLNL
jgi:hypothetical protein